MIVAFRSAKVRRVKALLRSKRRQRFAPSSLFSLRSGVGILPAIESTLGNRKLEAYATLLTRKSNLDEAPSSPSYESFPRKFSGRLGCCHALIPPSM